MSERDIPGIRRPLDYPRIAPEDRPDAAEVAEQRRLAGPHRRAKPRTTPPKEETK